MSLRPQLGQPVRAVSGLLGAGGELGTVATQPPDTLLMSHRWATMRPAMLRPTAVRRPVVILVVAEAAVRVPAQEQTLPEV